MSIYTDEMVEAIEDAVGGASEVTADVISELAESLEVSEKSLGAKLRSMGISTPKKATAAPKFTEEETATFATMVEDGDNAEVIAAALGKTVRQVYGKALSMKLHVTAPEKKEYVKKYTPEQEAQLEQLVDAGKFIEEIAEALDKTVPQIRGKLLSMKLKAPQRDHKTSARTVIYTDEVIAQLTKLVESGSTAAEVAEALNLNIRGVKSRIGKMLKSEELTTQPSDMGNTASKTAVDYTEEVIAAIQALADKEYTSAQAAEELNIPVASLRSKAGRLGIKFAKPEKVAA